MITFVASLGGLLLFVWSMSKGLFGSADAASRVIFGAREVGLIEEPAARTAEAQDDLQETMNRTGHTGEFSILSLEDADERARQDESGRWPVLLSIGFAVLWLVLASAFGLIASIKLHVLVIGGFAIYFVGLSIGGWLQGLAMLDAARPFIDSVNITKPYLLVRTMGGTLMTLGHLVFATHVAMMLMRRGSQRSGATLLRRYAGTPVRRYPVRRYPARRSRAVPHEARPRTGCHTAHCRCARHWAAHTLRDDRRSTIVDFIYTRCVTVCSALGGVYQTLQSEIRARGLESQVRLMSVSFDPAWDTPQRLGPYVDVMRADPAIWTIATVADSRALPAVLRAFGVRVIDDGLNGSVHNAALHVVDPDGRLVVILPPDAIDEALDVAEQYSRTPTIRR